MSRFSLSISTKIGIVFIGLLLLAAANLVVVRTMLQQLNGVAETISVAGKLRMLSQKIAFETIKPLPTKDHGHLTVSMLLGDFDAALAALQHGGTAFGYVVRQLPGHAQPALRAIVKSWSDYRIVVADAIATGALLSNRAARADIVAVNAERVLTDAEALVTSLTAQAQTTQRVSIWSMYGLLLLDALVLLVVFIVFRRQIVYPLRVLARQSADLADGRDCHPTAITSHDELGQLSRAFSDAAERIGHLISRIEDDRRQLQSAEAMFRGLAENAVAGVYIVQNGMFRFVNPKMAAMYAYDAAEMVSSASVYDIVTDNDRHLVEESIQQRLDGDVTEVHYERRGRRKDGGLFDVEVFGSRMEIDGQLATIGIMLDISERKRTERALRVLRACNQALVRASDETTLLADICRIFQNVSGYPFVWVGYLDAHEKTTVTPMAFAEVDDGVISDVARTMRWDMATAGIGVTGRALFSGQTAVAKNMHGDSPHAPWNEFLAGQGIVSALALPLKIGLEIVGALTVYSQDENAFTHSEVGIAEELADNLSFGIATLRTQAKKLQYWSQLEYHANHDMLTGLANRHLLSSRLKQAIEAADGTGHFVAVMLLDLDRFKIINDSLGHAAGDALLKAVAQRLCGSVRETDTVARLGGDEFVIVMPNLANDGLAEDIARKLLEMLSRPLHIANQALYISASVGISLYPNDGDNEEILLKNVDLAMYRAKQSGRANYQFYTEEINTRNAMRHVMETALHGALRRGELSLHFQPKVDPGSRRITGIEALARWTHPVQGMISPDRFIPVAEDTGLILPIGHWVLKTACLQNKAWQDQGLPPVRIAVNLSARQFRHTDLVALVKEVLDETGLAPCYLELELTESVIMQEPENAVATLIDLKALGVHISLDDFGTGYSSLNYLQRFPLDNLKIDKFFVNGINAHSNNTTIVKALIALAHNLNLKVTAEGVETEEELDFLLAHDCDEIQGYLFSRPLPAEQMAQLLRCAQVIVVQPR